MPKPHAGMSAKELRTLEAMTPSREHLAEGEAAIAGSSQQFDDAVDLSMIEDNGEDTHGLADGTCNEAIPADLETSPEIPLHRQSRGKQAAELEKLKLIPIPSNSSSSASPDYSDSDDDSEHTTARQPTPAESQGQDVVDQDIAPSVEQTRNHAAEGPEVREDLPLHQTGQADPTASLTSRQAGMHSVSILDQFFESFYQCCPDH